MAAFGTDYQALAHHWVYNDDSSHCYGNRMWSQNDVIYSYGTHFKIGVKMRDLSGVLIGFVLNSNSASNTTSKQQWAVKSAIPYHYDTIEIPDCDWRDWNRVLEYYKERYYYFSLKAKKARQRRDEYIEDAKSCILEMGRYIDFAKRAGVKIDKRKIGSFWNEMMDNGVSESDVEKASEQKEAAIKKEADKKAKANRKLHKEQLEKLEKWKNGELFNTPHLSTISESHLRIYEGRVQTSSGASVSLVEAKILARKISRGEDIKGYSIEGYTVIGYNGTLKIGCHSIPKSEVERVVNLIDNEE